MNTFYLNSEYNLSQQIRLKRAVIRRPLLLQNGRAGPSGCPTNLCCNRWCNRLASRWTRTRCRALTLHTDRWLFSRSCSRRHFRELQPLKTSELEQVFNLGIVETMRVRKLVHKSDHLHKQQPDQHSDACVAVQMPIPLLRFVPVCPPLFPSP
jgi:hypothetical protein